MSPLPPNHHQIQLTRFMQISFIHIGVDLLTQFVYGKQTNVYIWLKLYYQSVVVKKMDAYLFA